MIPHWRPSRRATAAIASLSALMTILLTTPLRAESTSTAATSPAVAARAQIEQLEQRVTQLERLLVTLAHRLGDDGEAILALLGESAGGVPTTAAGQPAVVAPAVFSAAGSATVFDQLAVKQEVAVSPPERAPSEAEASPQTGTSLEGSIRGATRVPYGGYVELHFNEDEFEPGTLDLHRFVLLFGHQFNDRVRFYGEVEIEHGLVEGGEESGELEVEQAFLDFQISPSLSARGGMMLTPIGILNENHEPSVFHGVERPFVDTFIIPSTWFSNGGGIAGRFGNGFSYKALAMSTLNAAFFDAEEGFRGGRQKGFFDDASNLAFVGRLEYAGLRDLVLGASYWTGRTGFEFPDISANASLFEVDARYRIGRFDLRGQYVGTELDDSAELNRALQRRTGINPNIAEEMLGYYLEGAVHLRPRTARIGLAAFYRYELFNTQEKMAPGFLPLRQFNREAHTVGLTLFPHGDVAVKLDYNFLDNESAIVDASDKWNFGIGWWF